MAGRASLVILTLLLTVSLQASPQSEVTALLERHYSPSEPGAVVLAVRDGEVIFRGARGLADVELQTPLRPEMLFRLGSITKQFTAAAILKLAAEGKLALSDPLSKYVSGFADTITLDHLLSHTAGVAEYTAFPEYHAQLRQDATVDEIVALVRARPLEFTPGTRYKYTNSAYFLLGAAIEKVTGETYAAYLRKAVLDPAGLAKTRMDSLTEIVPNRARGYDRDGAVLRNATLYSPTRAYAVGGLLSTVDDLRRWNEHALSDPQLARAFDLYELSDGSSTGYGRGWFVSALEGTRVVEHGGDIPGFSAHVLTLPEKKIFVAVLSNDARRTPRPEYIATKIAFILLGRKHDPIAVAIDGTAVDRLIGTYRNAAGVERRVLREGEKLYIERGGRRSEVLPSSATTFFYPDTFLSVEFTRDDGAEVLVLRNRGNELDRATKVTSSNP